MNVVYFPLKTEVVFWGVFLFVCFFVCIFVFCFFTSKQALLSRKTQSLGFSSCCTSMFLIKVGLLSFSWFWLLPILDNSPIHINLRVIHYSYFFLSSYIIKTCRLNLLYVHFIQPITPIFILKQEVSFKYSWPPVSKLNSFLHGVIYIDCKSPPWFKHSW